MSKNQPASLEEYDNSSKDDSNDDSSNESENSRNPPKEKIEFKPAFVKSNLLLQTKP